MEKQPVSSTRLGRALSIAISIILILAIAALIYVVALPQPRAAFTEFYLLGPEGKTADYPETLRVGETATVILGIVNWEHKVTSYRVEAGGYGVSRRELGPIVLEHRERFEQAVSFTPERPGEGLKIEFLLYKEGQAEIYQSLYLLVNVVE